MSTRPFIYPEGSWRTLAARRWPRQNVESSEYKHISLGLIFLKYVSDAFEAQRLTLAADKHADQEDPDEYLAANVFWVPPEARWSRLKAKAKSPDI